MPKLYLKQGDNKPPYERQKRQWIRCRAVEEHLRLLRKDPEYRWRRREIEREVSEWLRAYGAAGVRTGIIRIPVVVHVVWHTAAENISDAQIQSQIDVLNEDFRRLNADAASTPAPFAAVAADARIEFSLAVRGPGCTPTNGITRHNTSVTGWTYPGNGMKSSATGGADPWDSSTKPRAEPARRSLGPTLVEPPRTRLQHEPIDRCKLRL